MERTGKAERRGEKERERKGRGEDYAEVAKRARLDSFLVGQLVVVDGRVDRPGIECMERVWRWVTKCGGGVLLPISLGVCERGCARRSPIRAPSCSLLGVDGNRYINILCCLPGKDSEGGQHHKHRGENG